MTINVAETLRRNTRWSVLIFVIAQGMKFLLVPIVIAHIDYDGYTLVGLSFAFFSYMSLYNFGINTAYVNYTAEFHGKGEYERLSRILSTGMAIGLAISLVLVCGVYFLNDWLVDFWNVDPDLRDDARFTFFYVAVISLLTVTFGVYRSTLTGIQRIDAVTKNQLVWSVAEFFMVLAFLHMGYGVRAVVFIYGLSTVGPLFFNYLALKKILPQVKVTFFRMTREEIRPLFSLGGRFTLVGVVGLILSTLDTLILAKYSGFVFTGAYLVARRFASRIQMLPQQAFGPLAPASADLYARKDYARLASVFAASLRIIGVVTAYIFVFTAVFSDVILKAYLGSDKYLPVTAVALTALCISLFVHTLTGPGTSMLKGAGLARYEIAYQVFTIVLFVSFYAVAKAEPDWLVNWLEDLPWHIKIEHLVVLSFPVALMIASFCFILVANAHFKAPLLCPFSSSLVLLLATPAIAGALRMGWNASHLEARLLAITQAMLPAQADVNRWTSLIAVLILGIAYSLIFAAAAWYLPGLTRKDKEQVLRFLPKGHLLANRLGRPEGS